VANLGRDLLRLEETLLVQRERVPHGRGISSEQGAGERLHLPVDEAGAKLVAHWPSPIAAERG
jgi:hypothetical protein